MTLRSNQRRYAQKGGISCSSGFLEDKILNDCIKYDDGDKGVTQKRNEIYDLVASIKEKQKKGEPLGELDQKTKYAYLCLTGFDIDKAQNALINGDDIADACQATGIYDLDLPYGDNTHPVKCMAGNVGHNEQAVPRRYKGEAIRTKNQYVKETNRSQRYDDKGNTLVYNYCNTNTFVDPVIKKKIDACKVKNGYLDEQGLCKDEKGYQLGGKRRKAPSKKSSKKLLEGGKRRKVHSKKSSKKLLDGGKRRKVPSKKSSKKSRK